MALISSCTRSRMSFNWQHYPKLILINCEYFILQHSRAAETGNKCYTLTVLGDAKISSPLKKLVLWRVDFQRFFRAGSRQRVILGKP